MGWLKKGRKELKRLGEALKEREQKEWEVLEGEMAAFLQGLLPPQGLRRLLHRCRRALTEGRTGA